MNKLDEWWNGLDLDEKRNAVCNANEDCATCPLLSCPQCDDPGKVREYLQLYRYRCSVCNREVKRVKEFINADMKKYSSMNNSMMYGFDTIADELHELIKIIKEVADDGYKTSTTET